MQGSRVKRAYVSVAVLLLVVALFAVTMATPIFSSTNDFSIYNTSWNGASNIAVATYQLGRFAPALTVEATGTDLTIINSDLFEMDLDPTTDVLMILGPTKSFTTAESGLVGAFVKAGGLLVLADDFGTGNGLLVGMGASSRFSGKLMMDLSFDRSPEFSVCFDLKEDPLTANVSRLLMNYPTSISVSGSGTTVIAESSVASWLDSDGDRTRDLGEPQGPFPLIVRERMGSGSILLLSDPSILINGMIDQLDNGVFADNLVTDICSLRLAVYFDESHRDYFDPITATTQLTAEISDSDKFHVLIVAFVLLVWVTTDYIGRLVGTVVQGMRRIWGRILRLLGRNAIEPEPVAPETVEELLAKMMELHPEWKVGLLRHALRERNRHNEFLGKLTEKTTLIDHAKSDSE
ncbi:MAG: hypothetical protein KKE24_04235 [Candidatus Thermoplasmatota archaeon]|nr:hypothetical protein [Candidatus Thermoplasmatota archaeon]